MQNPDPEMLVFIQQTRQDFDRLILEHRFGIEAMITKINILREEFIHFHHYNPIEHVTSRLKTPRAIFKKLAERDVPPALNAVRKNVTDIAGVRITCSFVPDVYRILGMLTSQDDVRVVRIKDYIANPKNNGYKSVHAILEVPVFFAAGRVPVLVEVQIRTIAMDFWASLEHKIFYKYDKQVPTRLVDDLAQAAVAADHLDKQMQQLYDEMHGGGREGAYGLSTDPNSPEHLELDQEMLRKL